ncbi:universal stress protein [Candidatus Colwellia aromaticivorans]|uniref:universal stress protein n=1 Tax=Candidatus Colwellia aromaticivorans TaxID=2267621 RepID=UPI001FE24B50|nr:universal stress protein [Candidatus Colwellia aromaticivorans]
MQKILVPINFSNDNEQIIQKSMQMAKAFSSSIYLVHVEQPIKDSSGRDNGDPIVEMNNHYPDETAKLNALAHRIRDEDIETHAIFIEGVPSLSILDLAQKISAELIVMGTHGHAMITSLLLGGLSQAIIKESECPVLLVPI